MASSGLAVVDLDGIPVTSVVHRMLGDAVGVRSATELAGGHYNVTIGVVLADGRRIVLRAAPPEAQQWRSESHLMRNELAAAPTIGSLAPIPDILAADFSHRFIDRDLILQSWMPGVPAADALAAGGEPAALAIWRQVGQILSRCHHEAGNRYGRFVGSQTDSWSEQLANTFANLSHDFTTAGLDTNPIRICLETVARTRTNLDTVEPRLLHGDLGPGNVMVRSATDPTIVGLVDCDRSWWGDPAADWTFYLLNRRRPDQQQAFWTGYGSPTDRAQRTGADSFRLLLYLARSEAEASLELHRLGEGTKLRASQETLTSLTRRLTITGPGSTPRSNTVG